MLPTSTNSTLTKELQEALSSYEGDIKCTQYSLDRAGLIFHNSDETSIEAILSALHIPKKSDAIKLKGRVRALQTRASLEAGVTARKMGAKLNDGITRIHAERSQLQAQLIAQEKENSELKGQLDSTTKKMAVLTSKLEDAQSELGKVTAEFQQVKGVLSKRTARALATDRMIQNQQARIQEQTEQFHDLKSEKVALEETQALLQSQMGENRDGMQETIAQLRAGFTRQIDELNAEHAQTVQELSSQLKVNTHKLTATSAKFKDLLGKHSKATEGKQRLEEALRKKRDECAALYEIQRRILDPLKAAAEGSPITKIIDILTIQYEGKEELIEALSSCGPEETCIINELCGHYEDRIERGRTQQLLEFAFNAYSAHSKVYSQLEAVVDQTIGAMQRVHNTTSSDQQETISELEQQLADAKQQCILYEEKSQRAETRIESLEKDLSATTLTLTQTKSKLTELRLTVKPKLSRIANAKHELTLEIEKLFKKNEVLEAQLQEAKMTASTSLTPPQASVAQPHMHPAAAPPHSLVEDTAAINQVRASLQAAEYRLREAYDTHDQDHVAWTEQMAKLKSKNRVHATEASELQERACDTEEKMKEMSAELQMALDSNESLLANHRAEIAEAFAGATQEDPLEHDQDIKTFLSMLPFLLSKDLKVVEKSYSDIEQQLATIEADHPKYKMLQSFKDTISQIIHNRQSIQEFEETRENLLDTEPDLSTIAELALKSKQQELELDELAYLYDMYDIVISSIAEIEKIRDSKGITESQLMILDRLEHMKSKIFQTSISNKDAVVQYHKKHNAYHQGLKKVRLEVRRERLEQRNTQKEDIKTNPTQTSGIPSQPSDVQQSQDAISKKAQTAIQAEENLFNQAMTGTLDLQVLKQEDGLGVEAPGSDKDLLREIEALLQYQ
jgi:hypothetical protein